MPTKKPRLTITITESLAWQLQQLSRLTGQSQGGLIASLLEGSDLVLQRLIVVLEAAQEAKEAIPGRLAFDMREAQERIEQRLSLVKTVDQIVKRRAGRVSAAGGSPRAQLNPLSNRGGRSEAGTAKTSMKSRG